MKRKIVTLFRDLCCSQCKEDFTEDSVTIMRAEDELIVFRLSCQNCGKSFGVAFLGLSDFELKNYTNGDDIALKILEQVKPITSDEVLDAHKFIKNLDSNWQKFISDVFK